MNPGGPFSCHLSCMSSMIPFECCSGPLHNRPSHHTPTSPRGTCPQNDYHQLLPNVLPARKITQSCVCPDSAHRLTLPLPLPPICFHHPVMPAVTGLLQSSTTLFWRTTRKTKGFLKSRITFLCHRGRPIDSPPSPPPIYERDSIHTHVEINFADGSGA